MKQKKAREAQQAIQSKITDLYNLQVKIGSGAYGHVWKVQNKVTKKIYALKKVFSAFQNDTDTQRTYRQIQILKKCIHPNIVKLHQVIKAQNRLDLYLLFDYYESDLFSAIRDNVLNEVHKKYIIYQLAKVLKYLHSAGVVHRDLKPSNVLLNQNCILKLCDFGLSRTLYRYNNQDPLLTEFIATRWYRAPEVLLGSRQYDQTADLWSLGCLIYQLYAGKPLLAGDDSIHQIQKTLQFKGQPNQQQAKDMKIQNIEFILSHFNGVKSTAQLYMSEISNKLVRDLIMHLLQYSPKKRWTPQQILNCQLLEDFKDFEEVTTAKSYIELQPNDNKRMPSSFYINLINELYTKKKVPTKRLLFQSPSLHLPSKSFPVKQNSHSITSYLKSPYLSTSKRIIRKKPLQQIDTNKTKCKNQRRININNIVNDQEKEKLNDHKKEKSPIRRLKKNIQPKHFIDQNS